jgi:hypothetical protein
MPHSFSISITVFRLFSLPHHDWRESAESTHLETMREWPTKCSPRNIPALVVSQLGMWRRNSGVKLL